MQRGAFAIPILNYLIISKIGYRNFWVAPQAPLLAQKRWENVGVSIPPHPTNDKGSALDPFCKR